MKRFRFPFLLLFLSFFLLFAVFSPCSARAERILVVGDSITGHSMNLPQGYAHEVRNALKDAGVTDVEFIPLGGSGQQVKSWQSIVTESESSNRRLDIPDIFVKDEFDKGADTVLIFLGMNDVLCPGIGADEEAFAVWKADYQKLIEMVQKRSGFKKLILCPPTMLTESPYSFKNVQMDRMGEIVYELAKENHATVCDIRQAFKTALDDARKQDPTIHYIMDYVHPNATGHVVITYTILKAIGQDKAAREYLEKRGTDTMKDLTRPGMSLYVVSGQEPGKVVIRGRLRGESRDKLEISVPKELKPENLKPIGNDAGGEFEIVLNGSVTKLTSEIVVKAGAVEQKVKLNAPYRVAYGFQTAGFNSGSDFKKETARTQIDDDILAGKNPLESKIDGKPVRWLPYFPSADLTGGDDPSAIDFSALDNGAAFTSAYFVREVYSPEAKKARIHFAVNSFSTNEFLTVYVNDKLAYENFFQRGGEKTDSADIELRRGWNRISGRSNHTVWQWVISLNLTDLNDQPLPDLEFRQ